jgi:hypothetical protein
MTVTTRSEQATRPGTLPDVNAETYPYERVQQLLDETVSLSLAAVPDGTYRREATLTPGHEDDWFGINGGYGVDFESTLHRFDAVPRLDPYTGRLAVSQLAGEAVGRLHCRCLFAPSSAPWDPATHPAATIYDPWRSQKFVTIACDFIFGGERVDAYATGRTYPVVAEGEPFVLMGAVGNFMRGTGRFEGLEGTFVLTGRFTVSLGFLGNVSCRIVDPEGRIRTDREMPAIAGVHDPFADQTFIVLRGVKRDRTVRTTYGPPPGPDLVSLITPSQMRTILTEPLVRDRAGLRVGSTIGPVVASMEADVSFNIAAPPGTAHHPVPFTTKELYTFVGDDGRSCGTITAEVTDGVSFGLQFAAAPRQAGVRFAGFGPITGGTGQFDGAQGVLTVNSVIGIAPHTLSLLHVLHVVDRQGTHRSSARRRATPVSAAPGSARKLAPELEPLIDRMNEWSSTYVAWRKQFRDHAPAMASFVARWVGQHLQVGEFPGRRLDAEVLTRLMDAGPGPFRKEALNAYSGPAKGEVRQYDLETKREVEAEKVTAYRVWAPEVVVVDGRAVQPVTTSLRHHFYPTHLPDLCDGLVDVALHAYGDETGLTNWTEMYQTVKQQRAAIAYTLSPEGETLWFEKDVSRKDRREQNSVWRVSHEWRGIWDGRTAYYIVGFACQIDFDHDDAQPCGNRFWRALYRDIR